MSDTPTSRDASPQPLGQYRIHFGSRLRHKYLSGSSDWQVNLLMSRQSSSSTYTYLTRHPPETATLSPSFIMGSLSEARIPIKNAFLFETRGLIGGSWRTAKDDKTFPVYDPSSGEVLGQCSDLGLQDFVQAIDSAERGFKEYYSSTTAKDRGVLLRRWYDLMIENAEDCKLRRC